ncbi:hypothetical protein EGY05_13865 [Chryseobacterium arthrosphaerae]|uniref:hypothetical protein n=1 Tax=Chryseobacterium arthrosphaerae TaxID=651561 RepID=UPI000F50E6F6|nr:hypothetical protein [Chryseobacterium arthrosphaerae]AYZ12949.1 hypothetical protein EGY05_13865 [Chryseobacterium arthrosphaerae]UEQ78227.1 hypothetical protein J8N07_08020 [Chryseobacterium arthrosphaerae]
MSENKHISISKNIETGDQTDFHFLRRTGIEYIEKLGGKLWTDYNSHDPGITTLEVLSYAITDLGMRMNLNMEDILASEDSENDIHTQFLKAAEILPSRPLNELDYRKLFIDISMPGNHSRPIRNCWLVPKTEKLYVDCKTGKLDFKPVGDKTESFNVKGLYDLYVDYAEDIDAEGSGCEKSNVNIQILDRYHANRSLCEDLAEIRQVETQKVAVCARIGLVNKADEELVHAKVLKTVNNYLSPEVHFYSLKQMLDKGLTTDQIFEGPLLDNGFIDTEELKASQLRREVRLSDIISEIMKIDGVKEIHEISIAGCDNVVKQTNDWLLCIEKGRKPELCELSSFSYSKGSLPLNINDKKVQEYLATLKREEELLRDDARKNKELPLPKGTSHDIGNYATILNEFPDTYGVGISGIIGNQSPEREALAKQLQGYLLFFDQILAGYFKHLEKVKEVLSINGGLKRTFFTQALKNIKGFDQLVSRYDTEDDDKLTDSLYKELDNSVERRNEVLDHLISRFAETFSDYTFVMKSLYGKSTDEIVLSNKENFLKEYTSLSKDRGLGYNYTLIGESDIWNTGNISGVQKRIARLLGIKNYTQRNLSQSPVSIIEAVENGKKSFTWKIKDKDGSIVLSSVNTYTTEHIATKNLNDAMYQTIQIDQEDLEKALDKLDKEKPEDILNKLKDCEKDFCLIGNIKIKVSQGGNYYFEIIDDTAQQNVIAVHKKTNPYSTLQDLKVGIEKTVKYFKYEFTEEGIFLVEHLLLKPTVKDYKLMGGIGCMSIEGSFRIMYDLEEKEIPTTDPVKYSEAFMDSCEGCETDVFDPYSYRVSVVLPGFAYRFQDPDFRRYAETVIRQEIPAHILAKICWVGDRLSEQQTAQNDLSEFEVAFKKYLSDKSRNNIVNLGNSITDLLAALAHLNNIYRPGRLLDCDANDNDTLDGKIILGQSNLSKIKK